MNLSASAEVTLSVISYSLCSGSLVLINKLTLHHIPYPSLVITVQIFATLALIYGGRFLGILTTDPLKWEFLKPYLLYTVAFSLGVYTNMMSLNTSNVETVIIFRSLSPLVVSGLDYIFLGRELPSNRSIISLSLICVGAIGYANTDEEFQNQGILAYLWPTLYLFIICFEMTYGKSIVKSVDFKTASGPVQYTNLLGWAPMLLFAKMGGEFDKIKVVMDKNGHKTWIDFIISLPTVGLSLLAFGCIVGTGIGYTGWWCRAKVSATSFTLIGVINKFLTIVANLLIWDQHAVPSGIACLCLCILAGTLYQQAPMRVKGDKHKDDLKDSYKDLEMKVSMSPVEEQNDAEHDKKERGLDTPLLQRK